MKRHKVNVVDADGQLLFTRLWDDGGPVLEFDSPGGMVIRSDVERYGWRIEPGWPKTTWEKMKAKNSKWDPLLDGREEV